MWCKNFYFVLLFRKGKGEEMTRAKLVKLMDKLGLNYTAKISADRAEKKIIREVEKNGVPEDIDLTDEEIEYFASIGFEVQIEDDDEDDENDGEEGQDEENDEDNEDEDDDEDEPPAKSKKKSSTKKSANKESSTRSARTAKKNEILAAIVKALKKKRTRAEVVEFVQDMVEDAKETTIRTYLSDGKNPTYNPFEKLLVEDSNKKLSFQK